MKNSVSFSINSIYAKLYAITLGNYNSIFGKYINNDNYSELTKNSERSMKQGFYSGSDNGAIRACV